MATTNPVGRANYEPNSWGDDGGPRETPERGFTSFPASESGDKRRVRPELFADHFSQARQFYLSQTEVEQAHIADAFAFELSKVETPAIRLRMLAGLLNVDQGLARNVADGLGIAELPDAAPMARERIDGLDTSPALSILENGPESFAGRKLGVLVADGTSSAELRALTTAAEASGVTVALVAPTRHGISDSDGNELDIAEKIDGGPSVLFDAIAVVVSSDGAASLAQLAPALDFVTDAHHHQKFIAHSEHASALFEAAGLGDAVGTDGYAVLDDSENTAAAFVETCAALRSWSR